MAENGITGRPPINSSTRWPRFPTSDSPSRTRSRSPPRLLLGVAEVHYPRRSRVDAERQPLGFWSSQSLVADAQRHGVRVRRPDVNRSGVGLTRGRSDDPDVRLVWGPTHYRRRAGDARRRGRSVVRLFNLVRRAGLQQHHSRCSLRPVRSTRLARLVVRSRGRPVRPLRHLDRLPGVVTGLKAPALPATSEMERVADDMWSMGLTPRPRRFRWCAII